MTEQIKPSVTNPTIADIFEDIERGKLNLSPAFQRNFVWTQAHQEDFIDTILKGLPFPEIYVCQGDVDTTAKRTTRNVIDGQQRLTTIKKYLSNDFEKPLKIVPKFESLDEDQKSNFLSYQIVVRNIGKVEDTLVREIFRRINLTKFKLENIEIHNAIYDGQYIQTAKYLASNIAMEDYGVFHESEFTRMADIHFILQVMSTIERGGYYQSDKEIESCIAEFNEEYNNRENITATITKAFSVIEKLALPLDSIWFRKSNFFTLVVEFCMEDNIPEDIKSRLLSLENNIMTNKLRKDNEFGVYYGYMYSGTSNRKARVERSEVFRKHIFSKK